jgi:hypothetical protein
LLQLYVILNLFLVAMIYITNGTLKSKSNVLLLLIYYLLLFINIIEML